MEPKIKSKKTYILTADNEKILVKEELWDEKGNLLEQTDYHLDGSVENKQVFVFDDKGRLINEKNFIDNEELSEERIINRNADGLIVSERINYMDGSHTIKKYSRPEKKSIIIESIDSEEGLESTEKIKTDDKHRVVLREVYDEENRLSLKEENLFDRDRLIEKRIFSEEDGTTIEKFEFSGENLIAHKVFSQDNNLINATTYQYDEKNRLTAQKYSSGYSIQFEYNEDKNSKIEKYIQPNGIIEYQQEVFIDENGLEIEAQNFRQTMVYEYTFFD